MSLPQPRLLLVLDTNVVIDWLVFQAASIDPLPAGIRDGRISVLTHPAAQEELRRVLSYRELKLEPSSQRRVFDSYRAQSSCVSISTDELLDRSRLPGGFPRCRDQDDDLFVSLAFHGKADALVSRDHAVLRLRTRAKQYGVEILDIPGMIAKLEAQACERRRGQPAM